MTPAETVHVVALRARLLADALDVLALRLHRDPADPVLADLLFTLEQHLREVAHEIDARSDTPAAEPDLSRDPF